MNTQTLKANDWNNHETEFEVGQRVIVHSDDGTLWSAPITEIKDGLLHIADNETDGWERPAVCEVEQSK
jgi:hypothetical protein